MKLDEDKLYIKIIALDVIYNFIVKRFLFKNFSSKILIEVHRF
jgi:hypothetical protein